MAVGSAVAVDAPVAVAAAAPAPAPSQAGPDEAADVASARVTARLRNRRVEALSERTETSVTWVNPDGTRTTELNGGPVRVRQGDAWVPVDLRLVKGRDGVIRPKAHPRGLELAAGGGAGLRDLAVVRLGSDRDVAVQWSDALPEPRLAGNRAIYAEVAPGVDLVVEATRTGFEQFLVLNRKPDKGVRFTLPVRAKGLTMRTDADGNSELVDPSGVVVGAVPAAQMWDARVDEKSGNPVKPAKVKQRKDKKQRRAGKGGEEVTEVTVEPADGYLDDPGVRYPVTIDPSVGVYTYFDTFTESDILNTDQSGMGELRVGSYNGGSVKARSYLHFDMSAFRGARIFSSKLWLYETWSYSCSARNWEVWSTPLVGTGTRWVNQPAPWSLFATNSATLGHDAGCNPNWISTDTSGLQQAWSDQGFTLAGVMLKAQNESDSYGWKKFSSAEGGAVPHIDVTYNLPPSPTTGLNVSDRGDSGGVTYTRSATPMLTFRVNDPDGDAVRAFVYVYEGETLITHAEVGVIASGAVGQWPVPAGLLQNGRSYRFRIAVHDNTDWSGDSWLAVRSKQSNNVLDVNGCGTTAGSNIGTWTYWGGNCQRWAMRSRPGGFAELVSRGNPQVAADIANCGSANGTNVALWNFNFGGNECQFWAFDPVGSGEYKIRAKINGKALDVSGCSATAGANVDIWDYAGLDCQKWYLDLAPDAGVTVAWQQFTVDTTAPGGPFVSSVDYPNDNTWHKGAGQAGAFSFAPPAGTGDVGSYVYGVDTTPATEVAAGADGRAAPAITPTVDGQHVLNVRTKDRAGNLSAVVSYAFHVGRAGLVRPAEGARVVRRIPLQVDGEPVFTHVKFVWRRGPGAAVEADIPAAHLTKADGSVVGAGFTPLASLGGSATWNVTDTLGAGAGVVQVKAILATDTTGGGAYATGWRTVVVDPNADGAETESLGGGSLNLLTGDFALSSTDAEEFGLSVSRTSSSRDPRAGFQTQRERLTANQQKISTDTTGFVATASAISRVGSRGHQDSDALLVLPPATGTNPDTFTAVEGDGGALRLGMRAGHTYRVTGWVYAPAATGLSPADGRGEKLVGYVRTSVGYVETSSARPTVTDAWVQLSLDMSVPADATEAFVRLYNGFNPASGKQVYYDDLSVREITAPFGPQWDSGLAVDSAGVDYTRLSFPDTNVVSLETVAGDTTWFTRAVDGRFFPEPGAEDLTLSFDGADYRLSEVDGTVTVFSKAANGDTYLVASTTPPVQAATTRFVYESVDDQVRIKRAIAPTEPGVGDCTTPTPARGCEAMDYTYAATTTATASTLGDVAGQVSAISVWTTDPATGAVSAVTVARYAYDTLGRLREVWDPRLSTPLKTVYGYDNATGRVIQVTPPGELPWSYDFGTAGVGDDNGGRLLRVRRATLQPGSLATVDGEIATSVVYSVPLTRGAGGPYDLDGATVGSWAQRDVPTDATALFGPEDPTGVTTATGTVPGRDGYRAATVHYLNASGQEVNTATPGGDIDTVEHDRFGNTVRTLEASNRALALGQLPDSAAKLAQLGLAQYDSATRATWLDTQSTFSPDGLDEITALGPLQRIALDGDPNQLVNARARKVTSYDEDKPDGTAYHLATTVRTSATVVGMIGEQDVFVSRNGYSPVIGGVSGWGIRQSTSVTLDAEAPAGSLGAASTAVRYDAQGRARESRKLDATGTDAGTTLSVFYTAAANPDDASCGNRPEWAGQPCLTKVAGAVTGHDSNRMSTDLPIKRVESYTRFGEPDRVSESVAGNTRTTVTTYDGADRVTSVAITAALGSAVQMVGTSYDPSSGDAVTTTFPDGSTITRVFDKLGRLAKYTDADGAWTATTFDRYGKPATVTDSIGSTQTFGYDRNTEPRGFLTSVTDSVGGTITARYGPDGQITGMDLPGGLRLTNTFDPAGVPTTRSYTRTGDGALIAASSVVENIRGQVIQQSGPGSTKTFTYDRWARLTQTKDASASTGYCTVRSYSYDRRANRTGKSTRTGTTSCPGDGEPAQTEAHSYDSADRITDAGYRYDAFGRITNTPAGVANSYFVNDLLAGQQTSDARMSWTLDPALRFRKFTSEKLVNGAWANAVTKVNHYGADGDDPRWIAEDTTQATNLTRNVESPEGDLAVTTGASGGVVVQLTSLHGDVMATVPVNPATNQVSGAVTVLDSDEFGMPSADTPASATARYGWLGGKQRSAEALGGVVLMGARVYDPATGRFYQPDPEPGGNATAYDYCAGDPVNCTDLDGRWGFGSIFKAVCNTVAKVAEVASYIPGPIGSIAAGVSSVAYAATGNWSKAAEMAITVGAALVGATVAVKAAATVVKAAAKIAPKAAAKVTKAGRAVAGATKRLAAKSAGKAATVASKLASTIKNGNNLLRVGPGASGAFRVSIGPAYKHYQQMGRIGKALSPIHIHIEKRYGGVDFNWFAKTVKGKPQARNWTLWKRG
ncbi:MAG: RICIN domain-containing protein [Labedaea sp.]